MLSFRTGIKRLCALSLCVCLILSVSFFTSGRDRELTSTWTNRLEGIFVTSELTDASVSDLLEAMDSGRTSSAELTGMYLRRIESYDGSLGINSIITVNPSALSEAEAADEARRSGSQGRLLGIPVIISDSIDVQGMPTTNGDSSRLSSAASADSEAVRRLREEGAVIIGKANLSEDPDDEYLTRSSAGGISRNPYDLSLTTGGGAGGAAAAVAADFAALGIAVESGTSVRIPAIYNGLYALRPSFGIVGRTGADLYESDEDVISVFASDPYDAALVLDIISGDDPSDSATAEAHDLIPAEGYVPSADTVSFEGIRIGYLSNSFGYYVNREGRELDYPDELSDSLRGMLDSTLSVFTSDGAELVDLSRYLTEEYLNRLGNVGVAFSRRVIGELFEDYDIDALVYLSQLDAPESVGSADGDSSNPADYLHILAPGIGLPETVIPMITDTGSGMVPVGLSLVGKYGDDAGLLYIACRYSNLSGKTPSPSSVPALPDDDLQTLGISIVRAAETLLGEQTLSPEHRRTVSSMLEDLKAVSMTGENDTTAVSVAQYREMIAGLGSLMDTAELIISSAPVKNIVTLRYLIQKYRAAVSVSSVSVLLFVFAILLAGPGKRQRPIFSSIPSFDVSGESNASLSERLRSAAGTMRERRRLLKEARKALRNRDISKEGTETSTNTAAFTAQLQENGRASRIGSADGLREAEPQRTRKKTADESKNEFLNRLNRSFVLFRGYLHKPFVSVAAAIKKGNEYVSSLLKSGAATVSSSVSRIRIGLAESRQRRTARAELRKSLRLEKRNARKSAAAERAQTRKAESIARAEAKTAASVAKEESRKAEPAEREQARKAASEAREERRKEREAEAAFKEAARKAESVAKIEAKKAEAAERAEARKTASAKRGKARKDALIKGLEKIKALFNSVSGILVKSIYSLRSRISSIKEARNIVKAERLAKHTKAAEERRILREQKKADRIVSQRIKNAQKVDARERLLSQKAARREETERAKAALQEQKRQKIENRKLSRAKAAAINAERRASERASRRERFALLASSVTAMISAAFAYVFAALSSGMLRIRSNAAAAAEARQQAREAAREIRLEKTAVRKKERRLKAEERQELAYAAQQRRQAELQKKQAAEEERLLLRARYEQSRLRLEKEWEEAKTARRKERAAAALIKKKEREEKRAAYIAGVKDAAAERAQIRDLKRAEKNAIREQKAITKAANEQFRLLERKKAHEAEMERKAAAEALRLNQQEEKRKLRDSKRIEKKAAALFRKNQRKQRAEEFRSSVRGLVKNFFDSFKERAEQRRIRRAEELFLRNNELRLQKRHLEDLKAEQLRMEEENRRLTEVEQEKKAQAENARKEAAVAYRAMIDRKISEQVDYLQERSAQKREADLEFKRIKEEKQKEKAAQKAAEEARRREERENLRKEKEELRRARELAAEQRREKEKQLREEKKAELARLDFEKNKDKIIKAQRREIQKNERVQKRKAARLETAARRHERFVIFRTKAALFFSNIPYKIASIPYRAASFYKKVEEKLTTRIAAFISRITDQSEKAREVRAARSEERVEQRAASAQIRREKKEEAARVKADKKEAAAVAARLRKQEANDRKTKVAKAKELQRQERLSKKMEKRAAAQASMRRRVAAVRGAFVSVGNWISGIFSTTQNWLKRVFLLVSGIVTFIFMIPVRAVRALLSVPGQIAISMTSSKEKRLAKAEVREYKLEQKRIAREKQLVSGQSNVVAVTPASSDESVSAASGTIRNLEREAPFTFVQRDLRDIFRSSRGQQITAFISCVLQGVGVALLPGFVVELMTAIRDFSIADVPYDLLFMTVSVASVCLLMNFIGRNAVASVLRTVSKEMRRIEFSIRKDRDRSVSFEEAILRIQGIAYAKYDLVFDISVLAAAVVTACLSSLLSAAVFAAAAVIVARNSRAEEKRLSECRNVEEAVSVREAVSLDWARKLRVNKLLGRGNDSYDNVRNAVLDVNIRILSRRDVETDHDTAFRAICHLAIAGIALVSLFVPFGTAGCLTAASACLIVAPSAIRSAVGKFRILSDRHDLSKTVSSILADDSNASGERR